MGYPFGKAPLEDGTGTTPADLQRILGAQFATQGILPDGGLSVSGTAGMAYKVDSGACFMWTSKAARMGVLVPVDGATVPTSPAPASGSRTDTVYVDQSGAIRVAEGAQASGVTLARFTVSAGMADTMAAAQSVDRDYAIATGATLGRLFSYHDPANGVKGTNTAQTLGTGRFVVPSDRFIRFDLTHCISAIPKDEDNRATILRWRVFVDGEQVGGTFMTRAEWSYPQTNFMSFTARVPAGAHTVHYVQDRYAGVDFTHRAGGPDGWAGNRFEVWDAGAAS